MSGGGCKGLTLGHCKTPLYDGLGWVVKIIRKNGLRCFETTTSHNERVFWVLVYPCKSTKSTVATGS